MRNNNSKKIERAKRANFFSIKMSDESAVVLCTSQAIYPSKGLWLDPLLIYWKTFPKQVLDLLYGNDRRDEGLLNFVNTTMMGLVRMPYSNNWRVPEVKVHADCPECTVPAASGSILIKVDRAGTKRQIKSAEWQKTEAPNS